jgi:hypothetical protein
VPRHVALRITRLVVPLVVDYSASRKLVVDYSASRRLVIDNSALRSLIVDNSASRRLVVDYFASVVRPGATTRRAARHVARRAARRRFIRLVQARRRLLRLAQAHRRLLRLRRVYGCLGTSHGSSCGSLRRSSSTTSPTPRVRLPRHVARPVTRLIVDYSVRRDFALRPCWLYFSHAVHRDYLSRGNTGSTSSTLRAAMMSSSGRIASTIHLD